MKRLLVFLVLVGWAVPGWADSTEVYGIQSLGIDTGYSFNFYAPASLIHLGSPASALFDSVHVFPPKKSSGGGMILRLKGFYAEPKHPSIKGWPEIYCIYADTIIYKGRCGELTAEEVFEWLKDPDNESLWHPIYLNYIISKRKR